MSLTLEHISRGIVVEHRNIDDSQPDAYYADETTPLRFDRADWELRYWASGDDGHLVRQWKVDNAPDFYRGLDDAAELFAFMRSHRRVPIPLGFLHLAKIHGDTGDVQDFGLVSCGLAVVTDVGCQKIVAIMNTSDATTAALFKFHGLGTGVGAEAAGDTALGTELTTEYNPDSTRATGSQTTGGSTKVYRTIGTNTLDSGTPAVTEHGVFHQAATGGGSLLDRSKFSVINLTGANGDGLQATYDFTLTSGG